MTCKREIQNDCAAAGKFSAQRSFCLSDRKVRRKAGLDLSTAERELFVKEDYKDSLKDFKENGRKTFIQELNSKLETTIAHPTLKTRVSYKQLIRMELYKLQKFVTEGEVYAPFEAKW